MRKSQSPDPENTEEFRTPSVLDHKAQIVAPREFDGFLNVTWRSSIDTNYGHIPLLTRGPKCGVEVAALDGSIGKRVRLVVGMLGGTRLVRAPDAVEPISADIGAASRGRVVARCSRWNGMDERLGDFGGESLKFRVRWPTCRFGGTAAVLSRHRRQAKGDNEEWGEGAHGRRVLHWRVGGFLYDES